MKSRQHTEITTNLMNSNDTNFKLIRIGLTLPQPGHNDDQTMIVLPIMVKAIIKIIITILTAILIRKTIRHEITFKIGIFEGLWTP